MDDSFGCVEQQHRPLLLDGGSAYTTTYLARVLYFLEFCDDGLNIVLCYDRVSYAPICVLVF